MYGNNRYGGGRQFHDRESTAPVNVGEEIDVRIEAVGEKGDGIAKKNNFVIFVPGVKEGDTIRVRVTKVLRKVGFAEKIGDAQGPVAVSQLKQAPIQQPEPLVPEPSAEDSENFGEESSETSSGGESPVEESAEEFSDEEENV